MSCLFHADRHLNNNELHIGTSSSWVTASAGETLVENGQTDVSVIFLPSMAAEHNHGHRKTLPFSCCCVTWSGSSRRLNWHELRSLQRRPSHPQTVSQSVSPDYCGGGWWFSWWFSCVTQQDLHITSAHHLASASVRQASSLKSRVQLATNTQVLVALDAAGRGLPH